MVDGSMHSGTKDGVFSSKIWYRDWILWGQEPGQLWFLKIQLMLCSSPWEEFILSLPYCSSGLPKWCSGKEPAWQSRRCRKHEFHPWVGKSPWSRKWQHTPVFLPGKFHEQRSLQSGGGAYSQRSLHGRLQSQRVRHDWAHAHTAPSQRQMLFSRDASECVVTASSLPTSTKLTVSLGSVRIRLS